MYPTHITTEKEYVNSSDLLQIQIASISYYSKELSHTNRLTYCQAVSC